MSLLSWLNSGGREVPPLNTDPNYADPAHLTDDAELGGWMLVCRRCGAVVTGGARETHTTWHANP